jgi:hypothetical protein
MVTPAGVGSSVGAHLAVPGLQRRVQRGKQRLTGGEYSHRWQRKAPNQRSHLPVSALMITAGAEPGLWQTRRLAAQEAWVSVRRCARSGSSQPGALD